MRKITLPLVMIASFTALVSCGEKNTITPLVVIEQPSPTITGVVITPTAPVVPNRRETLSYNTPEGVVPIEFDVTVTDGIITAASAKTLATTDTSKYNQDNFVKAVSAKAVGKKAKDFKVDAIGGSSLTTAAFETFVHSF